MTGDRGSVRSLSRIEEAWMDSVTAVTRKPRWLLPYIGYTVESLAQYALYLVVSLPVILVALAIAGLSIGFDEFVASMTESSGLILDGITLVESNTEATAAVVAVLYLSSVLKYHPIDKNDYLGRSTPTNYEEWESMFTWMVFTVIPTTYFCLLYFEEAAILMEVTGLSAFVLSWIAFVPAWALLYYWMNHRYGGWNVSSSMDALWGSLILYVPPFALYLGQVAWGIDLVLYGEGMGAVFVVHLVSMVFLARRLRWTVYTDWAGYGMSPNVPLWGIVSRGPLAFAVYAVLASDGLTMSIVVATFSPLVASIGYIGWRAYDTGDLKKPPTGFTSSAGRKGYRKRQKKIMEHVGSKSSALDALENFNEFMEDHGLSTVGDDASMENFNPSAIKKELKNVHKYEATALKGADYTKYMDLRNAVREKL